MNEQIQTSPLARAYLSAVRAGQIHPDDAKRQLFDGAMYVIQNGVNATTSEVLRVVSALAEVVATLKKEDES